MENFLSLELSSQNCTLYLLQLEKFASPNLILHSRKSVHKFESTLFTVLDIQNENEKNSNINHLQSLP